LVVAGDGPAVLASVAGQLFGCCPDHRCGRLLGALPRVEGWAVARRQLLRTPLALPNCST
jgi:hypothetical protein